MSLPNAKSTDVWLYTATERQRRDASPWTIVQAILAPLQFLVFVISLFLVIRYVHSGVGESAASLSVVIKTMTLYSIMITGSFWEKDVFGRWLFAPAFFWEDVVSMGVIALHTLYLVLWIWNIGETMFQFQVALLAYAAYVLNALQFLYKFRLARMTAEVRV